MVNILRRWNQPIMVVITVLVIVSFVYWSPNISQRDGSNRAQARLYGKEIRLDDWKRIGKRVGIYAQLGGTYIQTIFPQYNPNRRDPLEGYPNEVLTEVVARSIVLDRECETLGITSTDAERLAILNSLTRLQGGEGTFDPRFLEHLKVQYLSPNGFTENDFDRVFLDGEVRAKKLKDLIGQTTTVLPAEIRELALRGEMQVDASYIAFKKADVRKELKVTDDELKKEYEVGKATYKTPEYRKVRFAAFLLVQPADGKTLTKEARNEQLEKAATKAYDLAQELKKPNANFDELAKKYGAIVDETKQAFSAGEPPAEFDQNAKITEAAFDLTKEQPYSSHISIDLKGSYVLALKEIIEPKQRPLEEVKGDVESKALDGKAKVLAETKAKEAQPKLAEAMKAGKKFTEAAQALNLKVEEFASITGRRPSSIYSATIVPETLKLAPGQISEARQDSASGDTLIVHLDSRTAGDEKKIAAAVTRMSDGLIDDLHDVAFRGWLKDRELAAGMATAFARQPAE